MRMLNPADPALDSQRLGDWLAAHGQDERTRRVLWDLFTVSSLNIPGDDASLALAATVVKTALLGRKDAADIGIPLAPLGELHGTAGLALLRRLGADVRLGVKAAGVEVADPASAAPGQERPGGTPSGGRGPLSGPAGPRRGRRGRADGVDGAGPRGRPRGDRRGRRGHRDPGVRRGQAGTAGAGVPSGTWSDLGTSPIINVHVIYDQRVTRLPFAAARGLARAVAVRPDRDLRVRRERPWPVPGDFAVGGGTVRGCARGAAAGDVRAGAGRAAARREGRAGQ